MMIRRVQMPLFQLCKETGQLQLEAMSALYLSELKIASASALGKLDATPGQGDHVPPSCAPPPLPPALGPPVLCVFRRCTGIPSYTRCERREGFCFGVEKRIASKGLMPVRWQSALSACSCVLPATLARSHVTRVCMRAHGGP